MQTPSYPRAGTYKASGNPPSARLRLAACLPPRSPRQTCQGCRPRGAAKQKKIDHGRHNQFCKNHLRTEPDIVSIPFNTSKSSARNARKVRRYTDEAVRFKPLWGRGSAAKCKSAERLCRPEPDFCRWGEKSGLPNGMSYFFERCQSPGQGGWPQLCG